MRREDNISPYLKRPLRSLEEVLRLRRVRRGKPLTAANNDQPPAAVPPAESA